MGETRKKYKKLKTYNFQRRWKNKKYREKIDFKLQVSLFSKKKGIF